MDTSIPLKRCIGPCGQELPTTKEFFRTDTRLHLYPDGMRNKCKQCAKIAPKMEYMPPYPPLPIDPIPGIPMKLCLRCEAEFPATNAFFRTHNGSRSSPDNLSHRCKWCLNPNLSKRPPAVEKDPNKKKCPQCKRVFPFTHEFFNYQNKAKGKLQPMCRECQNKESRTYFETNKGEKQEEWNARLKKNRTDRYEQYHAREVTYYAENRDAMIAHSQNRRARKKAVGGTYTADQVAEQLKRQHHKCYYAACGYAKFPRVKENGKWKYLFHIEHTFPVARVVGTDIPANDMGYIVLACGPCNESKNDSYPWEWYKGGRLL